MKLHGNAALSLNQRRRLARRVAEEDWSLTSAAAAAEVVGENLVNGQRLPMAARLLVARNASASVAFVFDFCKSGLDWPAREHGRPLNFQVMGAVAEIAEIVYPFSPGTA